MRLPTYKFSLPLLTFTLTQLPSTTPTMATPNSPTLYFAYGSNLSLTQMASRCPTSSYVALARLDGWKWIIGERGYANVIPSPSSPTSNFPLRGKPLPPPDSQEQEQDYVIGMLYTLEPNDEENLDLAEGVPFAYVKQMHDVELLDGDGKETGESRKVLVYVDVKRVGEGVCREEYVGRMVSFPRVHLFLCFDDTL